MNDNGNKRFLVERGDSFATISYIDSSGTVAIRAIMKKNDSGYDLEVYNNGDLNPIVKMQTTFGLSGSRHVAQWLIKGTMSKIGKRSRHRKNVAMRNQSSEEVAQ